MTTRAIDLRGESRTLMRYVVAGGLNTALAFGAYAAGIALGLPYQAASLFALLFGIAMGFVLQGKVTFRARLEGRLLPFIGLWTLLYFANIAIIGTLHLFGIDLYVSGLLAAIPVNALSYLALRTVVFAPTTPSPTRMALIWGVAALAIARLHIATHMSANWDEFLNLSMVYDYLRGETTEIFQTGFVHLFQWLPLVSANEVDQVIAARLLVLVAVGITSLAIFRTTRRFAGIDAALVALIAFNAFDYSLLYATDLRTDPFALAAMMSAVAIASRRTIETVPAIALGVAIALGFFFTIKSLFLLPTIAVLLLVALRDEGRPWRALRRLSVGALASVSTLVLLLWLHALGIRDQASAATFLARTGGSTLFTGDYRVLGDFWKPIVLLNFAFWVLVLFGLGAVAHRATQTHDHRPALSAFALPLLVPVIYSEVYPYFIPFLIAPLAVLAAIGGTRISGLMRGALVVLILLGAATSLARRSDGALEQQRTTLAVIHRLFPEPVPYIDHASMVSSFPKKGFFMSYWGVGLYRDAGRPVMPDILAADQPRFLLQTRSLLAVDRIDPDRDAVSNYALFREDVLALRDNYQRYWGPLFLPGMRLEGDGNRPVLIGGRYRLDADRPITIDGRRLAPGAEIDLDPGDIAYSTDGVARLLWSAPPPPSEDPPKALFIPW